MAPNSNVRDICIATEFEVLHMPISIRLPDDVEARLTDLSAKTGRS
jgi:RHH-type rel operon transcriptional repressor/antitoxin RelB